MRSIAEGGSDETSTEIHAINPSDLSLTRDPRMERESFGFSLGFTPRHYWQRMPGWEQASRTLTRDYTSNINRTSNSESTHNLRLRVAQPSSTPAASPRLPRSTSPWPPGPASASLPGSSPPVMKGRYAPRPARIRQVGAGLPSEGRNHAGSSRTPFRHARRTHAIWQSWRVPALSGLLPPSPAPPGSGCPQLHRPTPTGTAAKASHLRSNHQRRP